MQEGINSEIVSNLQNQVEAPTSDKSIIAIEEESQQKVAAERIRKRDPEDLKNNFDRAMKGIYDFYTEKQIQILPIGLRLTPEMILKKIFARKLKLKADLFSEDFNSTVFSDIIHFTSKDLGQETLLKSPGLLAKEKGVLLKEVATATNEQDIEIGNHNYVFAGSPLLHSRSQSGKYAYKIESEEGYAVPMDIVDAMSDSQHGPQLGDCKWYADNVYTFTDFKRLFSFYCAAVFSSPKEAIRLLEDQSREMWGNDDYWFEPIGKDSNPEIRLSMRNLFSRSRIFPPISPEFQFKDKVMGKRINRPDTD